MIEVEVEDDGWIVALADVEAVVQRSAQAALAADRPHGGAGSDLVVLLADDETVRGLNARFRGRDYATNVLSFPAGEGAGAHLGDLALALGVCRAEAEAQGKPLAHHLSHLVVHGVLHLLGRDHEDDAEAEGMEAEERAILAEMGIPDPYRDEG